ncbi:MAG: cation:proton antiporter [Candidatus Aegiribacteria sp. MLS_C]|nr:MAG: cation:proton antiporter [Candidatus Aegiribacteria sp. MLS_C]
MRVLLSLAVVAVLAAGIVTVLRDVPFGGNSSRLGSHFVENGREDTGAANIVTSVVLGYRGFDTLGEVTVLFVAAVGLGALLVAGEKNAPRKLEKASMVLTTGSRFLFPLILLFGAYIFIHGHLTPGGGFQGGAIIASGYLLVYLGSRDRRLGKNWAASIETGGGLTFVLLGLAGLTAAGHWFLSNFLPLGVPGQLLSAGIIPIIYVAIGLKVGVELTGVIDSLMGGTE